MGELSRGAVVLLAMWACACGEGFVTDGGVSDACPGSCIDPLLRDGGADGGPLELDGGVTDGGAPALDAGAADGGAPDAGAFDAGAPDAGPLDAGAADAGAADAGPRRLQPAPLAPLDASVPIDDGGLTWVDLTARDAPVPLTTLVPTFGTGRLLAVSPLTVLLAEGPTCVISSVNLYSCDYRWVTNGGLTLATVTNALGVPHRRGEVALLSRDMRTECVLNNLLAVRTMDPELYDVDTGALRKAWPRGGAPQVLAEGDLATPPSDSPKCDGGGLTFGPSVYTFTRPPNLTLTAPRALELGEGRILFQDSAGRLQRREADGGVAPMGLAAAFNGNWFRDLDTVFLDLGTVAATQSYQQGVDGGPVVPIATLGPTQQVVRHGGRFVLAVDSADPGLVRALDTQGLVEDRRYPTTARSELLQRAPLLVGTHPNGQLLVARLDQGAAAVFPMRVFSIAAFPSQRAALVLDTTGVAWQVDLAGVHRVASRVTGLVSQRVLAPRAGPSVLGLTRQSVAGGPVELDAVDDLGGRLVLLSGNLMPRGPNVDSVDACEVPGLLYPGGDTYFFAEATSVPTEVELFAVRSTFTQPTRSLGRTGRAACIAPVLSRDGARLGVQRSTGAAARIDVGPW